MRMLSRRIFWRLGRKMYMWARNDEPNDMTQNGELRLQQLVADNMPGSSRLVAFDVGARIGDWSQSLIRRSGRRSGGLEIHAFEPVPDSCQAIVDSLGAAIGAGQLHVNAIALSDELGTFSMYVPEPKGGTSTLHPDSNCRYERVFDVGTSTVDEYCRTNSIDHIDLVKVDTEGNDLKVIRGALGLVQRGAIGVLQFEYNHRWVYSRTFLKDVFDLVRGTPYEVAKVSANSLEIYAEWHPELERYFENNYALVNKQVTAQLKCRHVKIGRGNSCELVVSAA
jgi:FkbM family methyltransferase